MATPKSSRSIKADNEAKLVTLDVRLSNTAGASDEWFAPFPGTDGAIAAVRRISTASTMTVPFNS